jgi:hypothetical protein
MNQYRFTLLTRSLTSVPSRRAILRGLGAAGLGLGLARVPAIVEAKKTHKHKKRKPKAKPNEFGCLNVGAACKSEAQCCSGICEGKKGRRKCVGHNASICRTDSDVCTTGVTHLCNGNSASSACVLTTGQAGFCGDFTEGADKLCRDCRQDTDCQAEFGPGAACVTFGGICTEFCAGTGDTACVPAGD